MSLNRFLLYYLPDLYRHTRPNFLRSSLSLHGSLIVVTFGSGGYGLGLPCFPPYHKWCRRTFDSVSSFRQSTLEVGTCWTGDSVVVLFPFCPYFILLICGSKGGWEGRERPRRSRIPSGLLRQLSPVGGSTPRSLLVFHRTLICLIARVVGICQCR